MILLLISFLAGVLTVLAPCILPLIPVIIGGTLSGEGYNKKKALTIIISLGLSVVIFTLLLKASTLFIDIPESLWKWISGGIIIIFGLITLFPWLWENRFLAKASAKSNILLGKGNSRNSLTGDIIIGAALGPVFSTCSPTYFIVLATVLPVNFALGLTYLLAYTIGLCLSLLIVSLVGQKIVIKLGLATDPRGWFKKVLGIIFLIVGLAIIGGLDKKSQLFILDSGFFDITSVEEKLLGEVGLDQGQVAGEINTKNMNKENSYLTMEEKSSKFRKVPELSSIDGYINTDGKPITLAELRGKVVLLDIWTYSCINCQRTLPYINDWYDKYKDDGLVVVGLHTPEFAFEKVQANVEKAVKKFDIEYPVVLDNDYSTWNALGNRYWPRKYLIDIDGYIVYDHTGEGDYEETEKAIQKALAERSTRLGMTDETMSMETSKPKDAMMVEVEKIKSPETYFGSSRNSLLVNGQSGLSGEQTLDIPKTILPNRLYLGGTWKIMPEYAENKGPASIVFDYEAKNVYMAAGSPTGLEAEIYKDGQLVKKIMIDDETLYTLIQGDDYGRHTLRIVLPKGGLQVFTFTFG